MEVDKRSFYPLLLDLLTDISESRFVAFDLELSGVPSRFAKSDNGSGKPTLQERYIEVKEAAERYQILQIGLTCVHQDLANGKYVLKPYNFELSPLIEERGLDIERIFSFQSGAVDFLLKAGFDMSMPFNDGVPYLSRAESRDARQKFEKRQDKSAIADIQIKPTETESLAFVERVRNKINKWIKSKSPDPDCLEIGKFKADDIGETHEVQESLSRFEKRLVHQLVRAEYPDLVTISKPAFIQIVRFDQDREDKIKAERRKELDSRINKQKGFRWVIEALHGSQLANINLHECARDTVTGEKLVLDMGALKSQFHRAQTLLRGNPRVLVGHNCFLDLVYIYRTFIGPLPATVDEFQHKVHALWPQVVDTKYMSTYDCGDINPVSSLEQIATQLAAQHRPILEIDEDHMKYADAESLHEAGYDSFLTAQIAVRLSAKLEQEGKYIVVAASSSDEEKKDPTDISNGTSSNGEENITNGTTYLKLNDSPQATETGFTPSEPGAKWKRRGDPSLPPPDPKSVFQYNPRDLTTRSRDPDADKSFKGGMPKLSSDFWRVYGNKLRVFGTEEGVCVLDESAAEEDGGV